MPEQYSCKLEFKLSKNYNTIGGAVEFGREAKPNEKREALIKDVENTTIKKMSDIMDYADELLKLKVK